MRKVRDYDAELKALGDKARALKAKRVEQLGQLVAATGADALDAETLAGVLLDAIGSKDASAKEVWRAKGAAFFQRRGAQGWLALLQSTDRALRLNQAATLRAEAAERRTDSRGWVVQRRERTRHLIELGGLVQKAGLVELTDDDRVTLYGALLDLAGRARGDDSGDVLALWKRRGKRAFDAEAETETTGPGS